MSEDDVKTPPDGEQSAHSDQGNSQPPAAEDQIGANEGAAQTDNSNRMDAAKAFYRAIYAGDEADAGKHGMKVGTAGNQQTAVGSCVNCDQLSAEFEQAQAKTAEIEGFINEWLRTLTIIASALNEKGKT